MSRREGEGPRAGVIEDPKAVVDEQAEDEGLWFRAKTAPEAYLQQALRRLHAAVEGHHWDPDPVEALLLDLADGRERAS